MERQERQDEGLYPYPKRCHKCQKYGHRQYQCRQVKRACSLCAGEHGYTECPNKDRPKCANCGGEHAAVSRQCGAYNEVKSALVIAVKSKLSYRDALVQVKSSQKLGPSELSLVVQPTRQASTCPRTPEIIRRPEMKESETQTESISVKTKSCNTQRTQKKGLSHSVEASSCFNRVETTRRNRRSHSNRIEAS